MFQQELYPFVDCFVFNQVIILQHKEMLPGQLCKLIDQWCQK